MAELPEAELARSILVGLRPEFAGREATARQLGELKRRAHAEADRLIALGREAARFGAGGTGAGAQVLDQVPTLPAAGVLVAAHASLLRLVGLASVAPLFTLAEDPVAALPAASDLEREMDERGENFALAHEEWLARLLADNPAAASTPAFRTFFAGLSQSLRTAVGLRQFDVEAVLGAVASWQPARWSSLRG